MARMRKMRSLSDVRNVSREIKWDAPSGVAEAVVLSALHSIGYIVVAQTQLDTVISHSHFTDSYWIQ